VLKTVFTHPSRQPPQDRESFEALSLSLGLVPTLSTLQHHILSSGGQTAEDEQCGELAQFSAVRSRVEGVDRLL
jgi:hypothetical protein